MITFVWFLGLLGLCILFVPMVVVVSWLMHNIYEPNPLPKAVHRAVITLVSLGYIAYILYVYIPIYPG